jgi:hypothetical protein
MAAGAGWYLEHAASRRGNRAAQRSGKKRVIAGHAPVISTTDNVPALADLIVPLGLTARKAARAGEVTSAAAAEVNPSFIKENASLPAS